jgi:hypothetical protein
MSYHDDWHVIRFFPSHPVPDIRRNGWWTAQHAGPASVVSSLSRTGPNYFYSNLNSRLHTIEFLSNPQRGFEGESDAESGVAEGLIAGGTQDNGDIFLRMNPLATGPWTQLQGCDGGQNQFFNVSAVDGWVLHTPICGGWYPVIAAAILNFPPFVTNVEITPPVKKDPNGKKRPEGLSAQVRSVYRPTYTKGNGLMFAIAGEQASIKTDSFPNSVFGLFADPKKLGTDMEWDHLGNLPVAATTCAAYDGNPVVCGGADGNIYTLDAKNGNVQMMSMLAPFKNGTANRILYRLPALPLSAYSSFAGTTPQGAVLQFNGVQWNKILAFNDQAIQDIQVDESVSPEVIYVATDNRIYSSPDAGKTWFTDSKGLPERFHGSQLKIVRYSNGEKWLYLTTYGRSVWAANMAGGPITH